LSVW
jgi:hypothetical protein